MTTDRQVDFEETEPAEAWFSAPSAIEPSNFLDDALFVIRQRSRVHEMRRIDHTGTLFAAEREAIEMALFEMRDVHWTRDAFISFVYGVEGTSRSVWLLLAAALAIAVVNTAGVLSR